MKNVSLFVLILVIGITTLSSQKSAFALTKRPPKNQSFGTRGMTAPKVSPQPNARDMQVSTGQIPPVDESRKAQGKDY